LTAEAERGRKREWKRECEGGRVGTEIAEWKWRRIESESGLAARPVWELERKCGSENGNTRMGMRIGMILG
jgi:hypothetical protein